MALSSEPRYPSKRQYLLQLQGDAGREGHALSGRLEHIHTGERREFASAEQLLAVLEAELNKLDQAPP